MTAAGAGDAREKQSAARRVMRGHPQTHSVGIVGLERSAFFYARHCGQPLDFTGPGRDESFTAPTLETPAKTSPQPPVLTLAETNTGRKSISNIFFMKSPSYKGLSTLLSESRYLPKNPTKPRSNKDSGKKLLFAMSQFFHYCAAVDMFCDIATASCSIFQSRHASALSEDRR